MASGSKPKTRSATDHYMVGQEAPELPASVMPTRRSVLKEVLFKRNLPGNKTLSQLKLVSCGFQNFDSKCFQDGGCSEKPGDQKCSVFKIKWRYREAGVETMSDRNIAKKIIELYDLYQDVKKKVGRKSEGAIRQRTVFEESLDKLFDVSRENAEDLIRADSSRSKQRKEEDLAFFRDQKSSRKQGMSMVDHKHVKTVKNREEREERAEAQVQKEKERLEKETGSGYIDMSTESAGGGVNTTNTDKSMESLVEQMTSSSSRKRRRTRSGEARTITLEVPEDILEQTQQIATAKGISAEAHVDLVAAIITASGGDINDFTLSRASGYRTREKVATSVTENAKSEFRDICQNKSKKVIVHFDGKLCSELDPKKVNKEYRDRVAMLVRSPHLEQREQLLGIPELTSGTGMNRK